MKIHFLLFLCLICLSAQAVAQPLGKPDQGEPPYLKYPEMPAFNIRLTDSFTLFNTFNIPKGKPSLIIFFDPDCKHCQDMTRGIIRGMDSLKEVQMYWITAVPSVTRLKAYAAEHHFSDYPNIKVVGRDYEMFFIDYYRLRSVPTLALYDGNKRFVHLFEGGAPVKDIYEYAQIALKQ